MMPPPLTAANHQPRGRQGPRPGLDLKTLRSQTIDLLGPSWGVSMSSRGYPKLEMDGKQIMEHV